MESQTLNGRHIDLGWPGSAAKDADGVIVVAVPAALVDTAVEELGGHDSETNTHYMYIQDMIVHCLMVCMSMCVQ